MKTTNPPDPAATGSQPPVGNIITRLAEGADGQDQILGMGRILDETTPTDTETNHPGHSGHSLSSDPITAKVTDLQFPIEDTLNDIASRHPQCAFMTDVLNARLQRELLRYDKAAYYWQKAADLLPEENKQGQAYCLREAGYDLFRLGRHAEALSLFEQGLTIFQEIGDKEGEEIMLRTITLLHQVLIHQTNNPED